MKASDLSMYAFGVYLSLIGFVFLFFPDLTLSILGFDPAPGIWPNMFGLIVFCVAFFYYLSAYQKIISIYYLTCAIKVLIFFAMLWMFFIFELPFIFIIFALIDLCSAFITFGALNSEYKESLKLNGSIC